MYRVLQRARHFIPAAHHQRIHTTTHTVTQKGREAMTARAQPQPQAHATQQAEDHQTPQPVPAPATVTDAATDAKPAPAEPITTAPPAGPYLPLPAPPSHPTEDSNNQDRTTTIEVNGQAIRLDHFGPTIVNRDGTLARIANWAELTEHERTNTLRVLGKRNQLRLANLREESNNGNGSS